MATAREHIAMAEGHLARAAEYGGGQPGGARYAHLAQVHADLANALLQIERLDRAAATERLLADVKPSPRSLDPRRNRDVYNRRQNKKSPPVASGEDS